MNQTKIEEGEYIRLNHGVIFKADIDSVYFFNDKENSKQVKNHDKNIINLIEEGDYVNGKYVYSVGTAIGNLPIVNHIDGTFTPSNSIKSIVTKEQFANAEYRLEG